MSVENVALSSYNGKVHGQSLRKDVTKVDLLFRKKLDEGRFLVRQAAINSSHMRVVAPMDGVVAQRTVQLGQKVAAGTPLMAVVPLDSLWVDANFRETQLKDLRVGQPAKIVADVYGGKTTFHYHNAPEKTSVDEW